MDQTWTPRHTAHRGSLGETAQASFFATSGQDSVTRRLDEGQLRAKSPKADHDGLLLGYHKDAHPHHFMTTHRRQLSPPQQPLATAKGLPDEPTFDARLYGRKGRGKPPLEGLEMAPLLRSTSLAELRSPRRDILGQSGFQGMTEDRRPTGKRIVGGSGAHKRSSLLGAAAIANPVEEVLTPRRHWKAVEGAQSQAGNTFERVLGRSDSRGLHTSGKASEASRVTLGRRMHDLEYKSLGLKDLLSHPLSLVSSASSKGSSRYSGPQTETKSAAAIWGAYEGARQDYTINRTQGMGTYRAAALPIERAAC